MLENCSSLRDCEDILRPRLAGLRMLGELLPDPGDVETISVLIRHQMEDRNPSRVIRTLSRNFPCTFTWYLTWMGVLNYREGRFWPQILETVGLFGSTWEQLIGQEFLRALREVGFSSPEIPGANRYVAAILLQGGIPDNCISNYYRHVVRYFVDDNLLVPDAITTELELLRNEEIRFRADEPRLRQRRDEEKKLARLVRYLRRFLELREELKAYESKTSAPCEGETSLNGMVDEVLLRWDEVRVQLSSFVSESLADAKNMLHERQKLVSRVSLYTSQDERVLALADVVESLRQLLLDEGRLSEKCQMLRERASSSVERASGLLLSVGEKLDIPAGEFVGALWNLHAPDEFLASLRRALSSKGKVENELRQRGWFGGNAQARGLGLRLAHQWVAVAVFALCAAASVFGIMAFSQRGPALVYPLAAVSALSTLMAVTRARSIILISRLSRSLRQRWQGFLDEVVRLLSHAGLRVTTECAARVTDDDFAAFELALRERCTYEDVSSELEFESRRLQELRCEIDKLSSLIESSMSEVGVPDAAARSGEERDTPEWNCADAIAVCPVCAVISARRRKEEAERAVEKFRVLEPKILDCLKQALAVQLFRYLGDTKLKLVGNGDVRRGMEALRGMAEERRRIEALREEMADIKSYLGVLADRAEIMLPYLQKQLEAVRDEIRAMEESTAGPAFPYADEPVSNFLVYGGEAARDFLVESIRIFVDHARSTQGLPGEIRPAARGRPEKPSSLAERAFAIWLETREEPAPGTVSETIGVPEERLPSVFLSADQDRIMVRIPEIRLPAEAVSTRLVLRFTCNWHTEEKVLRVYRDQGGHVKTGTAECVVPFPCCQCEASVLCGSRVLRQWRLDLSGIARRPTFFDYRSGTPVKEDAVSKVTWVLLPPDRELVSPVQVVEVREIAGEWNSYRALLLDMRPGAVQTFEFQGPGGETVSVTPKDPRGRPQLLGELAGFTLEDEPVYLGDLPDVRIPLGASEIERWNINVWRAKTTGEVPESLFSGTLPMLKDMGVLLEERGAVTVVLRELEAVRAAAGGRDIEFFTVRVGGPRRFKQVFRFFRVSGADVWFEPALLPLESAGSGDGRELPGEAARAAERKVDLLFPESFRFEWGGGEHVVASEPGFASIVVDGNACAVDGCLYDDEVRLRFHEWLPELVVRFTLGPKTEEVWSRHVLQAWIGDIEWASRATLSVLVRHGEVLHLSRAELAVEGTAQIIRKDLGGESGFRASYEAVLREPSSPDRPVQIDFDLLQCLDSMRSCGSEAVLSLTLYGRSAGGEVEKVLDRIPVLRVQTEWLVTDLGYALTTKDTCTVVRMSWKEIGHVGQKVVRFWRKWRPWDPPITVELGGEETSVELKMGTAGLVPGPYAVVFDRVDPWEAEGNPAFERLTRPNVFDVDLLPDWMRAVFRGESDTEPLRGSRPPRICVTEFDGVRVRDGTERPTTALAFLLQDALSGMGLVAVRTGLDKMKLALDSSLAREVEILRWEPMVPLVGPSGLYELKISRVEELPAVASVETASTVTWSHYPLESRYVAGVLNVLAQGGGEVTVGTSPAGGRSGQVKLSVTGSGEGTLRVPQGVICRSCLRIFATHSEFHAHTGPGRCAGTQLQVRQNEIPVRVELEYVPFVGVSSVVRASGLRIETDGVFIVASWAGADGAGDWPRLFSAGMEADLKRRLFLAECEILRALRALRPGLTTAHSNNRTRALRR